MSALYIHSCSVRGGGVDPGAMNTRPGIVDVSTERLTSFEVPQKRDVLLFRWTVLLSLLALVATSHRALFESVLLAGTLGLLLAVNLILCLLPRSTFHAAPFEFVMGVLDAALLSYVLYRADPSGWLCVFFFLLLLITATARSLGQVAIRSVVLGSSYLLLSAIQTGTAVLSSVSHLMAMPLFFTVSLYFGYQVLHIRKRDSQVNEAYRERQELRIVLDVLESITSSLDFHTVMHQIATRIAGIVDAVRCSILLVEEANQDRAFVVASSSDPDLSMLRLDLSKYPEVESVIRRKKPLLIKDVGASELLRPHLQTLEKINVRSVMVVPVLYEDAVIGTFLISATRTRSFTGNDFRVCRAVASAAASAIKNSVLHRRLQEKAREHEETAEEFRSLFDHSPDLLLHLDRDGRIRKANRVAENLTGRSLAEIRSLDLSSLIEGLPDASVLSQRAEESNGAFICNGRLLADGNRSLDISMTIGAVGEPKPGLILIGRDMSDQKEAAAKVHQTEKRSSIGEIVATVAHELNNPLSGVVGFSQLLAQKDSEGSFSREIDRIVQSADRCQKVVQHLLTFAHRSSSEKKPIGLNDVVERTLDLLAHTLPNGITLTTDLAPDLPSILGDSHEIQQVFTNVITNAQQAMSANGEHGRLLLRTHAGDGRVAVEITDDGPGIPPHVLPRVFEPFFSTKKQGEGTGLGLSVSYGIMRDHGGELLVETRPGEGTTFSAVFPAATSEGECRPWEPMAEMGNGGPRILVVDDEPVIIDLCVEFFQSREQVTDAAATGMEALRKIEAGDYAVVVTDLKMPRMSGIQLYESAVKIKPEMKARFIFLTGDPTVLTSRAPASVSDVPCLMKPVDFYKLEEMVRTVANGGMGSGEWGQI